MRQNTKEAKGGLNAQQSEKGWLNILLLSEIFFSLATPLRNPHTALYYDNWSICLPSFLLDFLPRDALLSTVYAVVVCLCVCVCVCHTPVLYQNG